MKKTFRNIAFAFMLVGMSTDIANASQAILLQWESPQMQELIKILESILKANKEIPLGDNPGNHYCDERTNSLISQPDPRHQKLLKLIIRVTEEDKTALDPIRHAIDRRMKDLVHNTLQLLRHKNASVMRYYDGKYVITPTTQTQEARPFNLQCYDPKKKEIVQGPNGICFTINAQKDGFAHIFPMD